MKLGRQDRYHAWEALRLGRRAHDGLAAGRLNKPGCLRNIVVWNERPVTWSRRQNLAIPPANQRPTSTLYHS
jgi:hypothetical protein